MRDLDLDSTVDLWKLRESDLGRKGRRASDVRRKQVRNMAGEAENFGVVEFSIRIRDKREQNRLTKTHTHTNIHACSINSPLLKEGLCGK